MRATCQGAGVQRRHWSRPCQRPIYAVARPRRNVAVAAQEKEDILLRSLSAFGEVAVLVVDGTQLVTEAATRHKTAPTATAALGRTLMGALLLGSFRKEDENIQITFKGDGMIDGVMAIADTRGNVKGRVGNPAADPPLRADGKLAVGDAVGQGIVAVVRSHPLEPQPYTGMTSIVTGEIAEDLTNYLAESEQVNSAVALGVSINRDCTVKSAGGFMVQVLPYCSDETLEQLEANLGGLPSMTQMLNSGMSTQDITDAILKDIGAIDATNTLVPHYGPCDPNDLKVRMMRAVAALGADEVRSIMEEQGKIEVTCEMCNETYQFSEEAVMEYV